MKKPARTINPNAKNAALKGEEIKEDEEDFEPEEIDEEEDAIEEEDEEDAEEVEIKPKPSARPGRQFRRPQFPNRRPGGRPGGPVGSGGTGGSGVISDGEYITLDFKGELKDLIIMFSDLMNKNFIYDENIRDKVMIVAPNKLNIEEAWKVFLSVLDYKGYNVVESKEAIRIQKSTEARQQPITTLVGEEAKNIPDQAQIITYVTSLQYADVEQIRGAISQLISPRDANISTFPPTNTLILTDIASNINRIIKIINAIDVAGLEDRPIISVIPLHNASAKTLAQQLTEILRQAPQPSGKRKTPQPGQPPGEQMKIIPDERLNAIIIVATLDSTKRIEDLLEKLDAKLSRDISRINVYYLNNALAEDLQKVLTGIISKTVAPGAPTPASQGGAAAAPLVGRDVFITADKSTNSLIISASPEDYTLLKQIIEQLDIMRPQVYVEGLVVEVSQSRFIELGVDFNFLKDLEDTGLDKIRAIGLSSLGGPLAGLIATPPGKLPGFPEGGSVAITKGTVTLSDGTKVLNIPALATFFARTSGVNVLAQPQILTSDNEEASIVVGENRRFIRSTTVVSETANTVNTFEFRDVALNLKVTPHISKEGLVRLSIQQTVENVLPGSSTEQGVETSKREAKTTVVVQNQETIIIGGLIRETNTPSVKKIPCLGDIPWIGWFFSRVSSTREKTNLLIFLKPTVVNTPQELAKLSDEKKAKAREIREEDENKKDIFYKTIIDGNLKFWKKKEEIPMLSEESKVLKEGEKKVAPKKDIDITPELLKPSKIPLPSVERGDTIEGEEVSAPPPPEDRPQISEPSPAGEEEVQQPLVPPPLPEPEEEE
ncbi:MAG: type II secretion system protein GspD [Candidatus Schekmanbacteria bacterium RIFCSPHIGHO2_02_FULL_38_11]|uniref:Type II secretion system protein GspD n=1 Tax=Candidatus Schekmanbacteria bacterium RIFCSPLOWO2_12_FULL_38_15 TaxID=1817883 RepID=A0A1F7SMX7_9BACT|nr:MAG: type II secretion system protein GspD [Candidatus Schekmanbacteria bacterium GWA2_38_9]OGL50015.1 MAG: type II secretion system protein GspD [Candidatus Schekmanbacteria bacterium RIFCSPHIGHO2_02_FULL_38_11]OGL51129.1 MAG: type II secretion system protein GspD [Candidatus Schekmanbacteria bacterium RIFCSPLOWO2_02_FULL_38_14]OGL55129.1 MAG: type II secretion system protein GspD [Candidatus Schekmanbacteria bacterium RIFCSPLOWO2_12_FULL_38_15]